MGSQLVYMKPQRILRESFQLLLDQPRLFVPKIFSTLLASLFVVLLLSRPEIFASLNPIATVLVMLVSLLAISIIAVSSSMMLSSMVKNSDYSLKKSVLGLENHISNVFAASVAAILVSSMLSLVLISGYVYYLSTGIFLVLVLSALLFLVFLILLSYTGYFLPITLLNKNSLGAAFSDSFKTSEENRSVVIGLLVFSITLAAIGALSTGYLEKLGYIGFVAGRLVSSVVNTYIFVVSPKYYIDSSSQSLD